MIRSLWIARTGLDAQQTSLDVIANNLANVSTNGFKRSVAPRVSNFLFVEPHRGLDRRMILS